MSAISMKELLEAGVHFGHQTRRWNPKMKPYIFGARNGIHIVDLQKTVKLFKVAYDFIEKTVAEGYSVLFVGTKKQAHDAIIEESERCGMFYIVNRWLGGTLTNFQTVSQSINKLKELDMMKQDGSINRYTKKEIIQIEKTFEKLERNLGGIKKMSGLPGAIFVVDPKQEKIAVGEARKLGIPVVAITDTNCDPDEIDFIIPGNDDAIRAIKLICTRIADACIEGQRIADEKRRGEEKDEPEASDKPELNTLEGTGPEVVKISRKKTVIDVESFDDSDID